MTKHRKREEWIAEILEAAASVIDENGYPNLTMEAIASRTGLSKGGVYRFYKNKKDVALALFAKLYLKMLDFDVDEVAGWSLPIEETVFRLLFAQPETGGSDDDLSDEERNGRIWVQLLPETHWSQEFRREGLRLQGRVRAKYRDLVLKLIERDGILVSTDFEQRLETALELGTAMMQGLVTQSTTGASRGERAEALRKFIGVMMAHVLGGQGSAASRGLVEGLAQAQARAQPQPRTKTQTQPETQTPRRRGDR